MKFTLEIRVFICKKRIYKGVNSTDKMGNVKLVKYGYIA